MSEPENLELEEIKRPPAIRFEQVTKQYGQREKVLENISLAIKPGEFVSIIGPSGCGKSTLLKLVAGLTPVSSGTIVMERMTLINARRITSFIFQDSTLLPWRTVRSNVGLALELEGVPRERREGLIE